jgi:hypothetical protein
MGHHDLPFERARPLVDGMLGFDALKPWSFRKLTPQPACDSQGGVDCRAEFIGESGRHRVATGARRIESSSASRSTCQFFARIAMSGSRDSSLSMAHLSNLSLGRERIPSASFATTPLFGLQPVISLLDSDLPAPLGRSESTLAPEDVVLTLHDEGEEGRLFRMPTW